MARVSWDISNIDPDDAPVGFEARFDSNCKSCDWEIYTGDLVFRMPDGDVVCDRCAKEA